MESIVLEKVATEEFTVHIAESGDVIEAFYITKVLMNHLLKNNAIHPDLFIDTYETLKRYEESKSLFILKRNDVSLGILTMDEKEPEEFKNISWENSGNVCFYISRIYVLPAWRNKGVGSSLLKFAEDLAKSKGVSSIRIDTTSNFEEGNLLLMKHNYRFAGNVFYNFQKTPVNCYEKLLA